jgi:hypothetical protein
MDADLKKRLSITILAFVILGGAEVAYLMWSRRDTTTPKKQEPTYSSNQDDYVIPHKIVPYNLESAKKELAGKPVWVKLGNEIPYYRYDAAAHSVNFSRQAGLLPPLEKLDVKDVVLARKPVSVKPGQVVVVQKEIMLVFARSGEPGLFASSIGSNTGDDYTFVVGNAGVNDLFFFEDPHVLYKHWPADVWSAVDQHQVKEGMSELQATFAVGNPDKTDSEKTGDRTVEYPNAGKPLTVSFEKGKAVKVTEGKMQ